MSLSRLVRREKSVYLGGVRLWPSRFYLGGHFYTVGPVSLLRFLQVAHVGTPMLRLLCMCGGNVGALSAEWPVAFRPLVGLVVAEPVREADLKRMTPAQVSAVFEAFLACNDLPYLLSKLDTSEEEECGWAGEEEPAPEWLAEVPWDLMDSLDSVMEQRPQYTIDDLEYMPAEKYFALQDALKKKHRIKARLTREAAPGEKDDGFREMTQEDWARALSQPGGPDA